MIRGTNNSLPAWAIRNSPAMNLLMIAIMVVGLFSFRSMQRESFPNFDIDIILVSVPYPGAAPQEVEEGICQKIEEAVRSLEGIKKVTSVAAEGSGSVIIELTTGSRSPDRILDEVRSEIDRIPSFPVEAEEPEIQRVTPRRSAIRVGIIGPENGTELKLREYAERVRDGLLQLGGITQVDFIGGKDFQIDIEIEEHTLRSHGLSLQQVANIVRRENRELPAGTLRSDSQEILLRGNNRRTDGEGISRIPLITQPGGAMLTVADLGEVRDEFVDMASTAEINGRPALALTVERSSSEDMLSIVDEVNQYVEKTKLPSGYKLVTWSDQTVEVRGRLNLLYENATLGLLIVFMLLVLFLDLKLAFWVALGIPFALFAAAAYLYFNDQSLNMISMFAFVMALGIVVDDAIVVGENIYAHRQMGKSLADAAAEGAQEVMPSIFTSVSTTIVAFAPLLFVSGIMGKFMAVMPAAVIAMLVASLFESLTILPAHLAHQDSILFKLLRTFFYIFRWVVPLIEAASFLATKALNLFIESFYGPFLKFAIHNRPVIVSALIGILIIAVGFVRAGYVPFVIFPKLDGNTILASISFPNGTPESVTQAATKKLEEAFWRVNDQLSPNGTDLGLTSFRVVGAKISGGGPNAATDSGVGGSHLGSVEIELLDTEQREITSEQIVSAWRNELGEIAGVEKLSIGSRNVGPSGIPIEFKLLASPDDTERLEEAVERCKAKLAEYPGVFDISDDSLPGKWEYRFRIKPEAVTMGVRTADLAETVRAAYYGEEVMRVQRGRHEVKIMVRYPRDERRRLATFDELRVRLEDGIERPITELAEVEIVRGYSELNRLDQKRSITITADLDETKANARNIVADLQAQYMPKLVEEFPEVQVNWEGQQEQTRESISSLFRGFGVAILVMFVLLSFELKSYWQPLLILIVIPFGAIGAIGGHALLGLPLTMFSLFGLVGLTGIVVNDSIVLVDFINARMRAGIPVREAIFEAGIRRFRPVMLTTVTTVGGLMPILLETSLQAQILIPMATSIAFGEIFATIVVLILVPVGYSIGNELFPLIVPENSILPPLSNLETIIQAGEVSQVQSEQVAISISEE